MMALAQQLSHDDVLNFGHTINIIKNFSVNINNGLLYESHVAGNSPPMSTQFDSYSALLRVTSLLAIWNILAVLWGLEINHQILYVHRKFLLLTHRLFCEKLIVNNV